MTRTYLAALVSCWLLCFSFASAQSTTVDRDQVYSVLAGQWTGTLEYRDFQSNERVLLPTWLEVKPNADSKGLEFFYTYDDGPTKTVTEKSRITLDATGHSYTITSDRDQSSDSFQIESGSQDGKRIRLVLTGTGKENGKPVDVRILLTIDRNLYRFTKETRSTGQEFSFRDGYTFIRRNP